MSCSNFLRISIDGGAATGKSTIAKSISSNLGIKYVNTGQMYRLFALISIRHNISSDEDAIYEFIKNIEIQYDKNGNITTEFISFTFDELEVTEVSEIASKIAPMPKIRKICTTLQKRIAKQKGILMEGRDIGTVIMPSADFKFFLTVDPKIAAHRRFIQAQENKEKITEEEILDKIIERNYKDENREIAPLIMSENSVLIDTSKHTVNEIVAKIMEVISG